MNGRIEVVGEWLSMGCKDRRLVEGGGQGKKGGGEGRGGWRVAGCREVLVLLERSKPFPFR